MVEDMRVRGIGGTAAAGRNRAVTQDGVFSVDARTGQSAQLAPGSGVTGIGLESMLALQGIDEAAERDREARKRATAMIAALTGLQRAMLAGETACLTSGEMTELAADGRLADDPALAAILRSVTLRLRVELARREFDALRPRSD
jgi:hypothetical protein